MKIPPGVSKGSTLRVRGEGDAGPKGYANYVLQYCYGYLCVLNKILVFRLIHSNSYKNWCFVAKGVGLNGFIWHQVDIWIVGFHHFCFRGSSINCNALVPCK